MRLCGGPCPPGMEVCHNDGTKLNNNWWNLRYDTPTGNHADRFRHGTDNSGERSTTAKFIWEEVREIRRKYFSRESTCTSLALECGVSYQCIHHMIRYETWIE